MLPPKNESDICDAAQAHDEPQWERDSFWDSDEQARTFEVKAILSYNTYPLVNLVGFETRYGDDGMEAVCVLRRSEPMPYQVAFENTSAAVFFQVLEVHLVYKITKKYLFKKCEHYCVLSPWGDLKPGTRNDEQLVGEMLRHLSLDIINQMIENYRWVYKEFSIPPATSNSLLGIEITTRIGKTGFTFTDQVCSIRNLDKIFVEKGDQGKLYGELHAFMRHINRIGRQLVVAVNLLESGHYLECIATAIDFVHSLAIYALRMHRLFHKELFILLDNPNLLLTNQKAVELLNRYVMNKPIKQILCDERGLWDKYDALRLLRNRIVHSEGINDIEVTFNYALEACLVVISVTARMVTFARQKLYIGFGIAACFDYLDKLVLRYYTECPFDCVADILEMRRKLDSYEA